MLRDPRWDPHSESERDDAGALDPSCGLLIAAEPTDRGDFDGEPRSYFIPGQDAAWVKSMEAMQINISS